MADLPRTRAELQALLADNTSGNISPQDVRDFLASVTLSSEAPPIAPTSYRGAYNPATAYLIRDVVTSQGASWVALGNTTGNAPPTFPTQSNAFWQLLVAPGTFAPMVYPLKASIVDADRIVIGDSASTPTAGEPATTLWSTLKAALFSGTALKTTPVAADAFAITDSAAGNAPKRVTWANMLVTLAGTFVSKIGDTMLASLFIKPAGAGGLALSNGSAANTGLVGFLNAANTRIGYIGFVANAGGDIQYIAEGTTTGHSFFGTLTISGSVLASGELRSGNGVVRIRSNANSHVWFEDLAGTEKALIYVGAVGNALNVRLQGGTRNWAFQTDGSFYVGGATYGMDGNISGTVWTLFGGGYSDAFNAINTRIEQRALAFANIAQTNAVNSIIPTMAGLAVQAVGTTATLRRIGSSTNAPGDVVNGASLAWSDGSGTTGATLSGVGSWRCMGQMAANQATSWLRYA